MVGRTLDLKSAYKQLAVRPADHHAAIIGANSKGRGRAELYVSAALPFGATGSVMGFNWMARSLNSLAARLLAMIISNYYDDYPTLEDSDLGENSLNNLEALLELLGWTVSKSARKRHTFEQCFEMLGVIMDLTGAASGRVEVRVTPARQAELIGFIGKVQTLRVLRPVDARSFRGRFGFAYLSFEGRPLAYQLKLLSLRAEQCGGSFLADDRLLRALGDIARFLAEAKPRYVRLGSGKRPLILYTDGACEESTTAGAVMYVPETDAYEYWGMVIPQCFTDQWAKEGVRHAIGQAEAWPALVAYQTWIELLHERDVIHFLDNEGVRMGLVTGTTRSVPSLRMMGDIGSLVAGSGAKVWFARVPSPSNFSDDASRLEFSAYAGSNFKVVVPHTRVPRADEGPVAV